MIRIVFIWTYKMIISIIELWFSIHIKLDIYIQFDSTSNDDSKFCKNKLWYYSNISEFKSNSFLWTLFVNWSYSNINEFKSNSFL